LDCRGRDRPAFGCASLRGGMLCHCAAAATAATAAAVEAVEAVEAAEGAHLERGAVRRAAERVEQLLQQRAARVHHLRLERQHTDAPLLRQQPPAPLV